MALTTSTDPTGLKSQFQTNPVTAPVPRQTSPRTEWRRIAPPSNAKEPEQNREINRIASAPHEHGTFSPTPSEMRNRPTPLKTPTTHGSRKPKPSRSRSGCQSSQNISSCQQSQPPHPTISHLVSRHLPTGNASVSAEDNLLN